MTRCTVNKQNLHGIHCRTQLEQRYSEHVITANKFSNLRIQISLIIEGKNLYLNVIFSKKTKTNMIHSENVFHKV